MSKKFDDFILEESFVTTMEIKRKLVSNAGIKCNAGITINVKPNENNKKSCLVVLRTTITGENDMLSTVLEMAFKILLKNEKEAENLNQLKGNVANELYNIMNTKLKNVTTELYTNGMELPPLSAIVK